MLILVFSFIVCAVFYLYFKMRQFKTSPMLPIRQKMFKSMAGIPLGLFLVFFAINQIILFPMIAVYIVAAVFIALGLYVAIYNFNAAKHYQKFIVEEAEINGF